MKFRARASGAAAHAPGALWLCAGVVMLALAGCGSVQTTTNGGGLSSAPQSASDPQPPVISGVPPTAARVGVPYDYTPVVTDELSTALAFSITNMPGWASFNSATGELKGTPGIADVGATQDIRISASDGAGRATVGPFKITVIDAEPPTPPSAAPRISGTPPGTIIVGEAYSFTPQASDSAGSPLSFLIVNCPSWATFSTTTGELSGTPTTADIGSFNNIILSVSDGALSASLPVFAIKVSVTTADVPTISGSPAPRADAGAMYTFTPRATDPQGHALTFSIHNPPSWASFDTATGTLSGTPGTANVGNFPNITISVSNATQTTSLPAFAIAVSAAGTGPTITGNPATTVSTGTAYSFIPTASGGGGNALAFSIQNNPAWANFNTGTGELSGTPSAASLGSYPNILISVSDGAQSASLPAFTLVVTASTAAPTIAGTPPTSATVGSAYTFTPIASDPQARTLTFGIQNQPAWLTFSTTTGRLSGTPTAANVGSFPNITISVSNGAHTASLPAFAITVTALSSGTATLNWSIPTQNTNGTPLVNVAGYRIYYGVAASSLNRSVQVANPNATSYVLSNLTAGVWYFGIVDYTSSGAESDLSNIASKTVQ